jgi:hypothetical protein
VNGIELRVLFAPVSRMPRHQLVADGNSYFFDTADHRDLMMGIGRGDRVIVAVEADQRKRIRLRCFYTASLECLAGNRQQGLLFFGQQGFLRRRFTTQLPLQVPATMLGQLSVECLQTFDFRKWDQEVATREAQQVLDMPFLIGTTYTTEVMLEQVMALQT